MHQSLKNLIIFASGKGSNAEKIIDYFADRKDVEISGVFSNNPQAEVLKMAKAKGIPTRHFNRQEFYKTEKVLKNLNEIQPDLIVLAGFMWIVPQDMIDTFPDKIINIHPALLPKYGGKGMYGDHVHRAVLANREKETGISIHYIDEHYDEGELIAQYKTTLSPEDSLETIVSKVRKLEHDNYARVIDNILFTEK